MNTVPSAFGLSRLRTAVALALFLGAFSLIRADEQKPLVVPVWLGTPPGSEGQTAPEAVRLFEGTEHVVSQVHRPTLTVFLPEHPAQNHAAVLVIPGGGHREIWMDHEGYNIAHALNARGIAAFVLKYRLAREQGSKYSIEQHALADSSRAMRLIRSRAAEWKIDPTHLGVMGFSAGGELAALTASRYSSGTATASDPVDRESSRPAFQVLVYPAAAHSIAPTKDSPPAFLLCGEKDRPDISTELPNVYLRFREAGVSAELHILAGVEHGFGLRPKNSGARVNWMATLADWIDATIAAIK